MRPCSPLIGRRSGAALLGLALAAGVAGPARAPAQAPAARPGPSLPEPRDPALPSVFYIGDSTVRNGSGDGGNGEWGWGDLTAPYFDTTRVNVVNRARGGRSSRTYLTEGLWAGTLALVKPGDVVVMQFGHNDGGAINDTSRARGSIRGVGEETEEIDNLLTRRHEVVHSFGWYLRRYVADTRARGATPVVASLVPRNLWKDGRVERNADDYAGWAGQVARAEGVAFLDLNELVAREYERLGAERVKAFFPHDHTHTDRAGAALTARVAVEALRDLPDSPVAAYLATPAPAGVAAAPGGTLVLDASSFLDEIPTGHYLTDAASLGVPWIFNDTALRLGTRSNYLQWVEIPRAGRYHLYARTAGGERSGFRVAVNDEVIPADVGDGPLSFRRVGGFQLPAGRVPVRIMRIEGAPVLDVLVLSTDSTLTEAELKPLQLNPGVRLLREYPIPRSGTVKFGDVNGDRQTDFLVLTPEFSAHLFDSSGQELWSWEAPRDPASARRAENEAPGAIWDLDGDGHGEVIHWRMSEGEEWLVAADGRTGKVRYRVPWPTRPLPHVYNNFRIAIGRLSPGRPSDVVLLTDMGGTISVAAFDARLRPLWEHVEERKKDHLGHYVYPVDLDGDGIDEVQVGSLLLDARGREVWNRFDLFYDNHDHADSYRFPDLDHDGRPEVVSAHSEDGVLAMDARTGKILWQNVAEHSQQIAVGSFLEGAPGPQVVIGARTYGNRAAGEPYLFGQVQWFDPRGRRLARWPANPLNGNPVFAQGDWRGDGGEELFWYKFRLTPQGRGELYFPDDVYQMFDFLGGKAEEVITLAPGVLRVWGHAGADADAPRVRHTDEYLRDRVANLTHY